MAKGKKIATAYTEDGAKIISEIFERGYDYKYQDFEEHVFALGGYVICEAYDEEDPEEKEEGEE